MADVVSIKGDKIDTAFDERDLLAHLKNIVVKIEAGEIKPEIIFCAHNFRGGITIAEAVYLLSGGIYDLHWKVRQDVP